MSKNIVIPNFKKRQDSYMEKVYSKFFEVDFVMQFNNEKCIAVYTEYNYPLLIAKGEEYFKHASTKEKNYILKLVNEEIVAIYDNKGIKIIEATDVQDIKIIPYVSYPCWEIKYDELSRKNIQLMVNFYISIHEYEKKTLVFDVTKEKYIFTSAFNNTNIAVSNGYFIEKDDGKLKAMYNMEGECVVKVQEETSYLEQHELNVGTKYIVEFADKTCRLYLNDYFTSQQHGNKFRMIFESCEYVPSLYTGEKDDDYLILCYGHGCNREIYKYNSRFDWLEQFITTKKHSYFRIDEELNLVYELIDDKCIRVLTRELGIIKTIPGRECKSPKTYFEVTNKYADEKIIKTMRNDRCIEVYNIRTKDRLAATTSSDENIEIYETIDKHILCATRKEDYYRVIYTAGKILKGGKYSLSYFTSDRKVIGIYEIENEKNIKVFDRNANPIVGIETHEGSYFEIIKAGFDHMIIMAYDSNNDGRALYNEKGEIILYADKMLGEHLYHRGYQINRYYRYQDGKIRCNEVYDISTLKSVKVLHCDETCEFFTFTTHDFYDLIIQDYIGDIPKRYAVYGRVDGKITKLFDEPDDVIKTFKEYVIATKNNGREVQLIQILSHKNAKVDFEPIHAKRGIRYWVAGSPCNIDDSSEIHIYGEKGDKIVEVYTVSNEGFKKILESKSGINVLKDKYQRYFETDGILYNRVGNPM